MNKLLTKKISALDPRFRKKIEELFNIMIDSISLLYEEAIHDEKTGLHNNKFFETILNMEIEKAKREKGKLSLAVVDLDFFKKVNDTYGHAKGDQLLTKFAKIIKKHIRKYDIAARFGGDEFFILFPETDLSKIKRLVHRLEKEVRRDKSLNKYGITMSGGATEFRNKDTKSSFKKRADDALYEAKKTGRNRFYFIE